MPLLALSSGHKLGLGLVAGGFILFAFLSAIVIPRWRPQFPGRGFGWFILATVVLFLGTMTAVEIFGAEPKEAAAGEEATSAATTTGGTTTQQKPPSPALVAKGKSLYTSLGCNACHSLSGAKGVGPTWKGLAGSQVELTNGQTVTADAAYLTKSIDDPDAQVKKGFQPGIMSATIKPGSVSAADTQALVAFIQSLK